jgi:hypothetical protein
LEGADRSRLKITHKAVERSSKFTNTVPRDAPRAFIRFFFAPDASQFIVASAGTKLWPENFYDDAAFTLVGSGTISDRCRLTCHSIKIAIKKDA